MLLEQELPLLDDSSLEEECQLIASKTHLIHDTECEIDLDEPLYLFTWAPDPAELPNCSFELQHYWALTLVADFLRSVGNGCACVESTQLGNPHYHGWYQLSNDPIKERLRQCHVKTMARLSPKGFKVTKSKGHIKIHSWVAAANCLHYYKKDLIQSQLLTKHNPITAATDFKFDFQHLSFLWTRPGERRTFTQLETAVTLKEFYKGFYFSNDL